MGTKDILLIYPKTGNDDPGRNVTLPLALLFVGSPLIRNGFRIKLIDQRLYHITRFIKKKVLA